MEIILRKKHVEFLTELFNQGDGTWIRNVCKKVTLTDAHAIKLVSELELKGFIRTEKTGRVKKLFITDEGRKLADLVFKLKKYIL